MSDAALPLFSDLNLSEPLLRSLNDVGYETPSPIQAATIPLLLANRDVLGQAQTGTGKTAAFALPILSRIDIRQSAPQALVLAPTRELAIQVAEAFQTYAAHIPGFHVLPIYGGQSYGPQLSALRRGVHVIVGTPGRVIDHLEKGSLDLSQLKTLVLDEADEMLRMGFIEDVETILKKTPATRQIALFSATMPAQIKRIATTYLKDPSVVTVAAKTGTAENITQRYWLVSGMHKLDALTRILEAENFDGMIVFSRTKLGTEELASKLQARGFSAAAINGDLNQQQREKTIQQLKDGRIDILVATDVAARGLDVERISHVVNYDVPHDPESYTHRIGRTGRAGRSGDAILFITPRERGLLKMIERATRQPISVLTLPTVQAVNDVRIARFKQQIADTIAAGELQVFQSLIEDFEREQNVPAIEIAAALAKMARGDVPLLLEKGKDMPAGSFMDDRPERPARFERTERFERSDRGDRGDRFERPERPDRAAFERGPERERGFDRKQRTFRAAEPGMATYRIEVGYAHGVKPGNIVGAIANEANMDSKNIGRIEIYDDYSTLDMPADLPADMLGHLKAVRVAGRPLNIVRDSGAADAAPAPRDQPSHDAAPAPRARPSSDTARPQSAAAPHPKARPAGDASPLARVKAAVEAEPSFEKPSKSKRIEQAAEVQEAPAKERGKKKPGHMPMESFRIEVGKDHGVQAANIVGAIANEAGLESQYIGKIEMFGDHSTIELPDGMPKQLFQHLKTVWVSGQQLRITKVGEKPDAGPANKVSGGNRRVAEKEAGEKKHKPGVKK